jgi:hypothetical protein
MKNKLMRTTALVGSMIALGSGISVAQTTVSGNLDISYRAVSNDTTGTGVSSFRGFGKEAQINLANKGKLNNGMDYAAGFSLEFDGNDLQAPSSSAGGNQSTMQGVHTEGFYLNFISGNTTLHVGADHIQNPDSHGLINPVGIGYITPFGNNVAAGTAGAGSGLYPTLTNSPYGAYGIGVIQAVPGIGRVSAYYAPSATDANGGPDIGNNASISNYESTAESAIEIGFTGDLGVKGLTIQAFHNQRDAADRAVNTTAGIGKIKGTVLAGSYNFGQITAAVDYRKSEGGAKATGANDDATFSDEQIKGKAASLSFAATKDLSLGVVYGKADSNLSTKPTDEKIKIVAIGYNLGPVALNAEYTDVENNGGVRSADSNEFIIKASTRF